MTPNNDYRTGWHDALQEVRQTLRILDHKVDHASVEAVVDDLLQTWDAL